MSNFKFNGSWDFRAGRLMGAFLESSVPRDLSDHRPLPQELGLIDPLTSWYRRWYFLLRLDDAIDLAQRELREVGLVLLRMPLLDDGSPLIGTLRLREELLFAGHWCLRFHDVPGTLNDRELAVLLPDSGVERTSSIADKLQERLHEFAPEAGIAVSPRDGCMSDQLINHARAEARGGG